MFFVVILIIPIGSAYYHYFVNQDYDFLVEVRCDSNEETCYSRDCSNPDDCPPNGLSVYKQYSINALDFRKCSDNSCEKECKSGSVKCTEIVCGNADEDVCTMPSHENER
jgi:hypothetical protein